ncbi:unnamed protein product [Allacma fusca]|uniref:Uncharacterized protein n=1 Tax=Allacma fusca TaxID=39272 RepID=A0A8J2MEB8_9HEXA|nr:unnamed protein product [Allacma fusca]
MQPRHYREREQGDRSTDADKLSLFLSGELDGALCTDASPTACNFSLKFSNISRCTQQKSNFHKVIIIQSANNETINKDHGVSGREIVTGMQKLRRTTTSIYAAGSLCKEVHKCHQKTTHQFRL